MLSSLIYPTRYRTLGLSINRSGIRLLEISHQSEKIMIENYASAQLPAHAFSGPGIQCPDIIAEALHPLLQKTGCQPDIVVSAIPDEVTLIRDCAVSQVLSPAEQEAYICQTARNQTGLSQEQLALDYFPGPTLSESTDSQTFRLVACRRQIIDNLQQAINLSGLRTDIIETESFAIERALHQALGTESGLLSRNIALLDTCNHTSHICVLSQGSIIFRHSQHFDHQVIKSHPGQECSGILSSGHRPHNGDIRRTLQLHLTRALQLFCVSEKPVSEHHVSEHHTSEIDCLLITGQASRIPELTRMLEQHIGLPCRTLNPIRGCQMPSQLTSPLKKFIPGLLLPLGLALRKQKNA